MKTGVVLCCFTSLCLVLSSVASIDRLDQIWEIGNTRFGRDYPRHGLMLLHWFARNINIDNNDVIRVNFNPARGDYGSHRYHNSEQMFPNYSGYVYFSLGNLAIRNSPRLPRYVTQDYYNNRNNPLSNIERIVIRVRRNDPQRVSRVYITQHNYQRNTYNSRATFSLSTSFLRQIQRLINQGRIHQTLHGLYGHVRGLSALLNEAGYDTANRVTQYSQSSFCINTRSNSNRHTRSLDTNLQCETPGEIKLEVKSTSNGYARISWSEIPESLANNNINIALYKDDQLLTVYSLHGRTVGTIDTQTALNPGLRVKLLTTNHEIIWTGPEFDETNGVLPTHLTGYDASLQLYTKDGYACARVFIKKSFTDWKNDFYYSWVGFYHSQLDNNHNYEAYQYVENFYKNANQDWSEEYDIYEYQSDVAIGPGVQARFLLDKGYTTVEARTETWDGVINPVKHVHDELRKKK